MKSKDPFSVGRFPLEYGSFGFAQDGKHENPAVGWGGRNGCNKLDAKRLQKGKMFLTI